MILWIFLTFLAQVKKGDESMELEKDQLGPLNKRFKQDPSLQPTMESVTEPAEADSKSM